MNHKQINSKVIINGLVLQEGALYTVKNENSTYSVAKLLAFDPKGLHLRIYSNRYEEQPLSSAESAFNEAELTLKAIKLKNGQESWGEGHIALSHNTLNLWEPTLLQAGPSISEEELEGYKLWQELEGDYF